MNTNRITIAILGAADPEMNYIEEILGDTGVLVAYAACEDPKTGKVVRVHPGSAYRATHILCPLGEDMIPIPGQTVSELFDATHTLTVECEVSCMAPALVADHHRPGDPGFGRPPAEFFSASSLGQVVVHLARSGQLNMYGWRDRRDGAPDPAPGAIFPGKEGGLSVFVGRRNMMAIIPKALVLTAAADHCLGAAYRGDCPGVDKEELLEFRVATQVAFRNSNSQDGDILATRENVLTDVRRAIAVLEAAPEVPGIPGMKDMMGYGLIPQLPEAGTYTGTGYFAGPIVDPREGRKKFVCSGTPEQVRAWLDRAEEFGLVDTYGDPARGFAGGYLREEKP